MINYRYARRFAAGAVAVLALATQATAQASPDQTLYRTRAYLDSVATGLERSGKTEEAGAIRERLKVGDFYPGDKIVIEVFGGEEPYRDTLSVRANQELVIMQLPALSLRGVLRSEADSALVAQVKKYMQRPVVRTTPLVRFLVTGAVARPGFITVRGDAAVSDVVTSAGGLTNMSRLAKSNVKRGTDIVIDRDSLSTVLRSGMTLDQADIRAGDELVVYEKKPSNFTGVIWAASAAIGLVFPLIALLRN